MNRDSVQNASSISIDLDSLSNLFSAATEVMDISRPIDVRLVDTGEIVDLNFRFRNLALPTDVLTFPSGLADPLHLGDIAICMPYAMEQAAHRGVSLRDEVVALFVHGCLHLLGYDDIESEDRTAMQQKMNEVGEQIQIPIDGEWTSILHQEHEQ